MAGAIFDDVEPFVAVAEAGSFRGAAARLGVTPAAVSKAVRRLEEELGVRLFHRTTRSVALSAEGARFYESCAAAMAQVRAARAQVELAREAADGEVVVSASFVFGRFLARRLPEFAALYPDVRVSLRMTDRLVRLVEEQVDVALRLGALEDSSLRVRRLAETRWATVASPEYLARHGTPRCAEALATHRCLMFRRPDGKLAPWHLPTGAITPAPWLTSDQGELLVEAAEAGLGLCQAFGFMVDEAVRAGRLVALWADPPIAGPPLYALTLPGHAEQVRVRVLLEFLSARVSR